MMNRNLMNTKLRRLMASVSVAAIIATAVACTGCGNKSQVADNKSQVADNNTITNASVNTNAGVENSTQKTSVSDKNNANTNSSSNTDEKTNSENLASNTESVTENTDNNDAPIANNDTNSTPASGELAQPTDNGAAITPNVATDNNTTNAVDNTPIPDVTPTPDPEPAVDPEPTPEPAPAITLVETGYPTNVQKHIPTPDLIPGIELDEYFGYYGGARNDILNILETYSRCEITREEAIQQIMNLPHIEYEASYFSKEMAATRPQNPDGTSGNVIQGTCHISACDVGCVKGDYEIVHDENADGVLLRAAIGYIIDGQEWTFWVWIDAAKDL